MTKRGLGYLLWAITALVIAVPEVSAAAGNSLPFTTISAMTGHLERHHSWVELIVVAGIVFSVYSVVRVPPRTRSGGPGVVGVAAGEPVRTPGGRLLLRHLPDSVASASDFDNDSASWFVIAAALALAVVAVATWAAVKWWPDPGGKPHFHPAYVLYGSLALLFVVVPSMIALLGGRDAPFPTVFRTLINLEDWLSSRSWTNSLGPAAGWIVTYVVYAGLTILLLHLTLYPYPDITRILNPHG